jgi:hypothetical protein
MTEIHKNKKAYYKNKEFYVYYELADSDGERRILTCRSRVYATIYPDNEKFSKYFPIQMKYIDKEPNDESLMEFLDKFNNWRREAIFAKPYSVDLTLGDVNAYQKVFFSLIKNYDKDATIGAKEYCWFERCANNAIVYLKDADIEVNCTSYDRKMCYGNILGSDIEVPMCEGKETTLKTLPNLKDIKCGLYRLKVTTDNKEFKKCFMLSKANVYVDISVRFLLEFKDKFNLHIELIQDNKPNAYIYDKTMKLSTMTSKWLSVAKELKANYPTNPYIKGLASATWGVIQQRNILEYTVDEINEKKLDVGYSETNKYIIHGMKVKKGVDYYKLINTRKACKFQLRLKPWITAQARDDMGRLALKYLDNVVRIQTDSISFDKYIDINDNAYALEEKTTGLIHWRNVNCYHNKTNDYKSKNY